MRIRLETEPLAKLKRKAATLPHQFLLDLLLLAKKRRPVNDWHAHMLTLWSKLGGPPLRRHPGKNPVQIIQGYLDVATRQHYVTAVNDRLTLTQLGEDKLKELQS